MGAMNIKKIPINLDKVVVPVMQPIRDITHGEPPPPLEYGFLHPRRETLLYSRGGVGKGVIASYFAAKDTRAGKRIGILAYEPHPDEWYRRIEAFGGDLDLVDIALPISEEDGWLHGPIWDQAAEIKAYCVAERIERLYVDSLMPATKAGGDSALADPSVPDDFYVAMRTIDVPSLVLGHLPASATRDNLWKPWGSVYWVNYSRIAWSLWYDEERRTVEVKNQKRNVYRTAGPFEIDWSWADTLPDGETPEDLDFEAATTVTKVSSEMRIEAATIKAFDAARRIAPDPSRAVSKTRLVTEIGGKRTDAFAGVERAIESGIVGTDSVGHIYGLPVTGSVPVGSHPEDPK